MIKTVIDIFSSTPFNWRDEPEGADVTKIAIFVSPFCLLILQVNYNLVRPDSYEDEFSLIGYLTGFLFALFFFGFLSCLVSWPLFRRNWGATNITATGYSERFSRQYAMFIMIFSLSVSIQYIVKYYPIFRFTIPSQILFTSVPPDQIDEAIIDGVLWHSLLAYLIYMFINFVRLIAMRNKVNIKISDVTSSLKFSIVIFISSYLLYYFFFCIQSLFGQR